MSFFYGLTNSYALTLLFFTIVVQIALLPIGIKQQRSQIRMSKIKPKEQAIRQKYVGRTDAATKQKVQHEVLEMYKRENYSPMSGCLPMLIQLPIIFALFNIVRRPLTYIAGFGSELIARITEFLEYSGAVFTGADPEIQMVRAFEGISVYIEEAYEYIDDVREVIAEGYYRYIDLAFIREGISFEGISEAQQDLFLYYENMDFGFFGQSLLNSPSEALFSPLIIILILNFAAVFIQTRLTKRIQAKSALQDMANNKSMKIMEYTMPLMILYFTYIMNAALGLYWIYRSVAGIIQTLVLSKLIPIPEATEEELLLAEQQYGTKKKKKKKSEIADISEIGQGDESDESDNTDGDVKKAAKRYTVKRRKNK